MACCEKDKIDTESSDIFNFLMDNLELSLNLNLEFVIKGKKIQGEKNIEYENYLNINFKKYEIVYMLNKFLININSKLNRTFNNISYTGAIRALGERYYRIEDDSSISETINNDISKKLFSLYKNNKLEKFNNFIHQHLNFEIEIKTLDSDEEEIFYCINIKGKDEISKNLVDVGAGYSQILPILFACFEKDKNPEAIIIIEQPELHLHPKMQSDLIDLFLKISNSNPELKLIIETHSNIIVDRIGKNIYKNNYDANNVNLLIFNKNDKLEIIQTKYDKEGTIEKWPARFFSAKDIEKWPPSSLKVEIPQKIRKILFSK